MNYGTERQHADGSSTTFYSPHTSDLTISSKSWLSKIHLSMFCHHHLDRSTSLHFVSHKATVNVVHDKHDKLITALRDIVCYIEQNSAQVITMGVQVTPSPIAYRPLSVLALLGCQPIVLSIVYQTFKLNAELSPNDYCLTNSC